ncbi:MAG: hypothetical protein FJ290_24615 [Planctomycetes bacterium]|nr:hypothetical protein [Planctomycetota bacterium]
MKQRFLVLLALAIVSCSSETDEPTVKEEAANLLAFNATMDAANRASRVINNGQGYSMMSSTEADELMKHYREALAHADKVDSDLLEKRYKGWGEHFDREYRAGLRSVIRGMDTGDATVAISGQRLMQSWGMWYRANVDAIRGLR